MKYYGSTSDNMYPHAFRLAEVYLNRAEAYAAKGMTAEALREVNALRENGYPRIMKLRQQQQQMPLSW